MLYLFLNCTESKFSGLWNSDVQMSDDLFFAFHLLTFVSGDAADAANVLIADLLEKFSRLNASGAPQAVDKYRRFKRQFQNLDLVQRHVYRSRYVSLSELARFPDIHKDSPAGLPEFFYSFVDARKKHDLVSFL